MKTLLIAFLLLFFTACEDPYTKPVANAGIQQFVITNSMVSLDGSKSVSNNGKFLSYRWSFQNIPSSSSAIIFNESSVNASFYADVDGEYSVQLIVNDTQEDSDASVVKIVASKAASVESCVINDTRALHEYAWQYGYQDNNFSKQYNMTKTASICLPDAWSHTKGSGVKVAIIDDSFELNHEDFGVNIINSYNVKTGTSDVSNDSGYTSHGTHTLSLLAALENTVGGVGVAPEAEYIVIKPDFFDGTAFDSEVIEALEYARTEGAQVISNSWGSDNVGDVLSTQIKSLHDSGITLIFAVGNDNSNMDGSINDESELPWVIGVGASSEYARKTSYSNYGSNMDILAPGGENVGVLSADEMGSYGDNRRGEQNGAINNNYHMFRGTSGAAPQVAGVAALILSVNAQLTPTQVREIIIKSADKIGDKVYDTKGFNKYYGYGKINAKRAVELALTY